MWQHFILYFYFVIFILLFLFCYFYFVIFILLFFLYFFLALFFYVLFLHNQFFHTVVQQVEAEDHQKQKYDKYKI